MADVHRHVNLARKAKRASANVDRAVIVAVAIVCMMQVSTDHVIDVIAV